MNETEVKLHIVCKVPGTKPTLEWNIGASGDVALRQVVEMAIVHFSLPKSSKVPTLGLKHHNRVWRFPDYYDLRRIAGFAHTHELEMVLDV